MNYTNLSNLPGWGPKVYREILDYVDTSGVSRVVVETWIVSTERPEIV